MLPPPRRSVPALLGLAGILLSAGSLEAQAESALRVFVTHADTRAPVAGAVVRVVGTSLGGITAADGSLRLAPLAAGPVRIRVQQLGYAHAEAHGVVEVGRTATVRFDLRPEPIPLAPVRVVARERRAVQMLTDNGFYHRRAFGIGSFITREQIEARNTRVLSDVLRGVSGVALADRGRSGGTARASFTRVRDNPGCPVQYFLNGVPAHGLNIDDVSPVDVEALEMYSGSSQVPIQFNRFNARCGVIVIWTRLD
jgi:hypothetical protein